MTLINRLYWSLDKHFPDIQRYKFTDDDDVQITPLTAEDLQELNSEYYHTSTIIVESLFSPDGKWAAIEFKTPDGQMMNHYQLILGINNYLRMVEQVRGRPIDSHYQFDGLTHIRDNVYRFEFSS